MTGILKTTQKNLMVFSGRAHPQLAQEVAEGPSPRRRIFSRLALACSGVMPYFCVMCSVISWPSAAMPGFNSNGWKCSSARTSPLTRSRA